MKNRTIWKAEVKLMQHFEISMPANSVILSVQMQENNPALWFSFPSEFREAVQVRRRFSIVGTGYEHEEHWVYHGTFQTGPYVWHLFEEP